MTFEQQLAFGKAGESLIANWLKRKGYSVLPVYEKEMTEKKGPQVFTLATSLIAPDLLVFGCETDKTWWIEAKHKAAFTWHRKSSQWVTGIDLSHYADYLKVQVLSPWPIWLFFLQRSGKAKDTPQGKVCPTGLYGNSITFLQGRENHRHANWGKSGMVYWGEKTLTKLAKLDEVITP